MAGDDARIRRFVNRRLEPFQLLAAEPGNRLLVLAANLLVIGQGIVECLSFIHDMVRIGHDETKTVDVEMIVKLRQLERLHALFRRNLVEIVVARSMVRRKLEIVVVVDIILRRLAHVD